MNVLLLGAAGAHGRRVAVDLAGSDEVDLILAAGRERARLARLREQLGGPDGKLRPLEIDLRRPGSLAEIGESIDVVASCAAERIPEGAVVAEAIDRRVSFVSLTNDESATADIFALEDRARAAHVTIIPGCGFSPGVTNVLVALACAELDDVREIEIHIASSTADVEGDGTLASFILDLSREALFVSDGVRVAEPGGTSPRLVYFPEPVGWVETFRSAHPEIYTVLRRRPHLRSLQYRVGIIERAAMDAARASKAAGLVRSEQGRRACLRMARSLRSVFATLPRRGPSWTAARVDVWGSSNKRPATISLGVVDHLANLASVPLAHAAIELGAGRIRMHGVHPPDEALDTTPFLAFLAKRGIRIARLEPVPV